MPTHKCKLCPYITDKWSNMKAHWDEWHKEDYKPIREWIGVTDEDGDDD